MQAEEKKVFDGIMKVGVLIGSRAWGVESINSDYDICVNSDMFSRIETKILELGIDLRPIEYTINRILNTKACEFKIDNRVINLIEYTDHILPVIKRVNEMMIIIRDAGCRDALKDKRARKFAFEGILGLLLPIEMEQMKKDLFDHYKSTLEPVR